MSKCFAFMKGKCFAFVKDKIPKPPSKWKRAVAVAGMLGWEKEGGNALGPGGQQVPRNDVEGWIWLEVLGRGSSGTV
jgi:hypothetical protein